jgi:hypothetical protein
MSYLIPNILFYTLTMRANSWLLKMSEIRFLRIWSDCCGPQKSLACYRHKQRCHRVLGSPHLHNLNGRYNRACSNTKSQEAKSPITIL